MAASNTPHELATTLVASMYRAEQLDLLHLSVINLLEMAKNEELDLVISQESKSAKQKELFITKLIESIQSPELRDVLTSLLKTKGVSAFLEHEIVPYLEQVEFAANQCVVVKLSVAVQFKEKDIKEMAGIMTQRLGAQAVLSLKVDHTLLGGAIVQHGSFLNDFSLKTQLDLYRSHWRKAVVEKG